MTSIRLGMVAAAVLMAILMLTPAAAAAPVEGADVHGTSHKEGSTFFQMAVLETSRTAFPVINWYIYAPDNATIRHVCNGVELLTAEVSPGLHRYTITYEPADYTMSWQIGETVKTFSLRISNTTSAVIDEELEDLVAITVSELSKIELDTALGCIALTLVPSVFMIPFWRRRKQEVIDDIL